jgi:hypothetical protein
MVTAVAARTTGTFVTARFRVRPPKVTEPVRLTLYRTGFMGAVVVSVKLMPPLVLAPEYAPVPPETRPSTVALATRGS